MRERLNGNRLGVTLEYWEGTTRFVECDYLYRAAFNVIHGEGPTLFFFSRDSRDDDLVAAECVQDFYEGVPSLAGLLKVVPDEEMLGYLRIEKKVR